MVYGFLARLSNEDHKELNYRRTSRFSIPKNWFRTKSTGIMSSWEILKIRRGFRRYSRRSTKITRMLWKILAINVFSCWMAGTRGKVWIGSSSWSCLIFACCLVLVYLNGWWNPNINQFPRLPKITEHSQTLRRSSEQFRTSAADSTKLDLSPLKSIRTLIIVTWMPKFTFWTIDL